MKPSEALPRFERLDLSDDDFAWIGVLVAYWSYAEHLLEALTRSLAAVDQESARRIMTKRSASFGGKAEALKKMAKTTCDSFPLHAEAIDRLITKGKALSDERIRVVHWVAFKSKESGLRFAYQPGYESGAMNEKSYSYQEFLKISNEIMAWALDLQHITRHICYDGPLASRTKWPESNGPQPTLKLSDLRTI